MGSGIKQVGQREMQKRRRRRSRSQPIYVEMKTNSSDSLGNRTWPPVTTNQATHHPPRHHHRLLAKTTSGSVNLFKTSRMFFLICSGSFRLWVVGVVENLKYPEQNIILVLLPRRLFNGFIQMTRPLAGDKTRALYSGNNIMRTGRPSSVNVNKWQ